MSYVIDVMKKHRSVRSFSQEKIEQRLVEEIISTAQMASTSNFIQAYSVIKVDDRNKRKLLVEFSGNQHYVGEAPVFLVFCADLYRIQELIKQQGLSPNFTTIESFLLTTIDTALFAQNVILAAESQGLGGVYIGGLRNSPKEVSELLELPELVFPLFGMCFGYPGDDLPEQKTRLPLSVVLHHDTYKLNTADVIKKYNQEVKEYYINRTSGKRSDTWSELMAKQFSKPLRPHLKSSINEKGFRLE